MIASVCCITYNHEKFISTAIESFLSQKTNFDFEVVIGEDCSKDKTLSIVQSYKKNFSKRINLLANESNIGMMSNFFSTIEACQGKYIALCEGDDYWTDPYKLQKQVDFLEANPDYGLVHSNVDFYYETEKRLEKYSSPRNNGGIFDVLLFANQITTLTVLVRKDLLEKAVNFNKNANISEYIADYPMWLYISTLTKIKFIDEVQGVYRVLPESAFNSKGRLKNFKIQESISEIQFFFAEKFGRLDVVLNSLIIRNINHLYFCAFNYLPLPGKKAYNFLKKYHHITWKLYLLFLISQNQLLFKVFKMFKK